MTTNNTSQAPIEPPAGTDPSDPKAVANSINDHFVSIGQHISPLNISGLPTYLPAPEVLPEIYPWEVKSKLSKIGRKKAGGPDGIPSKLIREFSVELSDPLCHILNESFQEGTVPSQWKRAVVVPLPKSKPATWNQLRPVSLTDHFSKVAESFVTDWVMDDIEPQIDHGQFGSRKERSTTHYLVKLVDFILKHLERFKSMSRITVTDFSKAFDCVDHNIAIPKLIKMGTRPAAIQWICDFLSNRSQCVRYHNVLSDWQNLSGGVPQGTLNGPIIFMVLANDAARMKDPNKLALKYVDDLTVIENINTRNGSTIQSDLDNFDDWALCNNMKLNPTKCMYCTWTSPL